MVDAVHWSHHQIVPGEQVAQRLEQAALGDRRIDPERRYRGQVVRGDVVYAERTPQDLLQDIVQRCIGEAHGYELIGIELVGRSLRKLVQVLRNDTLVSLIEGPKVAHIALIGRHCLFYRLGVEGGSIDDVAAPFWFVVLQAWRDRDGIGIERIADRAASRQCSQEDQIKVTNSRSYGHTRTIQKVCGRRASRCPPNALNEIKE